MILFCDKITGLSCFDIDKNQENRVGAALGFKISFIKIKKL